MSKIYLSVLLGLLFLSSQCFAQVSTPVSPETITAPVKSPGVPGACGYPSMQEQDPNAPTPENGNGSLGQIYNFAKCGLNFVQASMKLGKRGSIGGANQPANFAISGIPACAVIEQAYLWSGTSGSMAHNVTIVNPLGVTSVIPMVAVGTGPDKCWGYSGTTTYRANVTAAIAGNGNYTISGLPTNPPNAGVDTDGATLMIIYSDPTATYRGHMIIHDGTVVINGGSTTQTLTGINACANSTNAIAFSCIADLQMAGGPLVMNGTTAPFTWNWWNYTQVATTVTAAQATSAFNMTSGGDCYNFAVAGLYYQTTSCVTCTSPALTLTPSSTPASCSSCNGSASVTVTGGTAPYTYSWAPSGGTGSTATGLCAGTYTVTVSDASGCNTSTVTATVTSAAAGSITVSTTPTNVTCNTLCNGSVSTSVTGGTAPYTYSWAPSGGTGSTASSLCAGTYTVTVTDANGCTGTGQATITQPPALTASITSSTNVSCNAACNGSATVAASGGTGAYTYSWAPSGGTGATATGLCAGTYTVTVTDANGCTTTANVTITQPPALTATITASTNVTCNALCNGSATVTASGGTAGYTYSWAPSGGTGATATGLCAGTYTVTVTDANGCTTTANVTITQPPALTASITASSNATCNALCNGSATVAASGGTAGYTYSWAPSGGTGATATGLCAGTYTVTVTDANGCTATASVTITQPPALTASITASTNATCNASCNGSATVAASGGTPGYTYSWAPAGGTGSTATGLCAGTYTVTVTDASGCTTTANVTITQPPAVTATITASSNASCNGVCDGTATVAGGGGTPGYTYSWAPAGGTGATATGLCAGTYTVTVTDVNGCTATANVTITQPPALALTTSFVSSTCGNANGSATVNATGGTPVYSYSWNTTPVQTTATATGLAAGTYVVTVTDANTCTATATVTVTNAGSPTATITASTNITCNALCNGSATVSGTGGAPPYTYSWAPSGGTGSTATGLCAGTYTATITDANGCTATATVTITQPPALSATISASLNVSCNAACNGSATVAVTGGTGPYTYSWAPAGGTGATASNLCAGTYTVTITDANGCTATANITITEPPALTASTTQTNVSCNAGTNGTATVTPGGGTPPYTYSWSTTPPQTTATAINLAAGTYTVTVTDASCAPVGPQLVTNGDFSSGNTGFSSSYTYCNGPNCITGSGMYAVGTNANFYHSSFSGNDHTTGSGNFMIINGASTAGVSVWCQTVNVTPNTNYNFSAWVSTMYTVSPAQLQFSINNVPIGSVFNAPAAVGTWSQFNATWNSGSNTTATICILNQNTAAGGNDFGLDDISFQACGTCTTTATVTITEPTAIALTTSSVNSNCGNPDGSATVNATGGTPTYTYAWSTTPAQASSTATGLVPATYSVVVTDANNCSDSITVTVGNNAAGSVSITASTDVSCFNGNDGTATTVMTGGAGPFNYLWSPGGGTAPSPTGLSAGSYTVTVTDANNCITQDSVTIAQPTALTAAITASTQVTCNGACDGSATVSASGGTGPYTYSWAPAGGTGATASGLCAGTYTVTVTDANACTDTAMVTITEPPVLTLSVAGFDATCNGGCDGQVVVIPSGGTAPYIYSWSPGGCTTPSCNNLCAGTYSVTVTDANGCTATGSATVSEPPALALTMGSITSNCNLPDGSAWVNVTGGTPGPSGYSYSWTTSPVQSTDTATALVPGTYTVVVSDFNQCTALDSVIVPNTPGVVASIASQINTTCFAACDGEATASGTGGVAPYTYSWSTAPAQTTATATGLCAGTYTVTITDASGCTDTAVVTITEPAQVVVAPATVAPICIGQSASLSATSTGGTGAHTYEWNPGNLPGSPVTVSPITTQVYTVVATDANGCTSAPQTVTVTVNPPLQVIASGTDSVCPGGSVTITAAPSGGNGGPYFYTWSPATGLSSATVQSPSATPAVTTTYVVTVTDNCTTTPATDSVVITVNPLPVPQLTSDITEGCTPVTISFTDQSTISSGSVAGWSWDFGDNNSSASQNPTHTYTTPGTYAVTITATSDQGCVATSTTNYTITAHELPVAEFTFGPQPATILDAEICFTNESIGLGTCTWDFGDPTDNTISTQVSPCHTYPDTGTYCVTLHVETVNGCTDSVTYCLIIQPDFALYVPNAFTPNMDDVNDKFFPKGIGMKDKTFKLYIFDRWGNMIFYSEDINNGWDGRANGGSEVAQQDVYVWKIEVIDLLDKKHNLVGHVTLIR